MVLVKYNLCTTPRRNRYFIECVKNDIHTYHRTDREPSITLAYKTFKELELGGNLGFESNSNGNCAIIRVEDFEIIFSFNTLEELEKEIVEYLI